MRALRPMGAGLRAATSCFGAAVALWVLGLVLALPVGLMTAQLVHRVFGRTLIAEPIAARFLPLYGAELFASQRPSLLAFGPVVVGVVLLWLVLTPWMQGFGLGAVRKAQGGAAAHAGRHYGRLLRLWPLTLLWSGVVLAPLGALAVKLAGQGVQSWTSERGVLGLRLAIVVLMLAIAAWLRGSVALMRAAAVLHPEQALWRIVLREAVAAGRQPVLPFASVAGFFGLGLAASLVGSIVHTHMRLDLLWVLVCALLLQQATALFRVGLQLALHGTALEHIQSRRAPESAA